MGEPEAIANSNCMTKVSVGCQNSPNCTVRDVNGRFLIQDDEQWKEHSTTIMTMESYRNMQIRTTCPSRTIFSINALKVDWFNNISSNFCLTLVTPTTSILLSPLTIFSFAGSRLIPSLFEFLVNELDINIGPSLDELSNLCLVNCKQYIPLSM